MSWKIVAPALALLILGCLASYRFGIRVAQQGIGSALAEVQLMSAFDHMRRYEELRLCLELEKFGEAEEKLGHSVLTEKELVAELLRETTSSSTLDYIERRTDQSVETLRSFNSNRGSGWSEPACHQ